MIDSVCVMRNTTIDHEFRSKRHSRGLLQLVAFSNHDSPGDVPFTSSSQLDCDLAEFGLTFEVCWLCSYAFICVRTHGPPGRCPSGLGSEPALTVYRPPVAFTGWEACSEVR